MGCTAADFVVGIAFSVVIDIAGGILGIVGGCMYGIDAQYVSGLSSHHET